MHWGKFHRLNWNPFNAWFVSTPRPLYCDSNSLITNLGEMAAIANCTAVLTDHAGPYRLSPSAAQNAFHQLSLYTNAESCPMCASAIRWAGFKEYIYGTSIDSLIQKGWGQIRIGSMEVFQRSFDLESSTRLIGNVLVNETDPYFAWQYDPDTPCPVGCQRMEGSCAEAG